MMNDERFVGSCESQLSDSRDGPKGLLRVPPPGAPLAPPVKTFD
jgi:hypothetical protein